MSRTHKDLEDKVRQQAKNRCGYCLVPQKLVSYKLEIEHFRPKSKGGVGDEENLWLACRECNLHKAAKLRGFDPVMAKRAKLFNPRKQRWKTHFVFSQDKTQIIGKTICGRATVEALEMNNNLQTTARRFWTLTGLFPPEDL